MGKALLRKRLYRNRVRRLPFWALLSSLLLSGCGKEEKVADPAQQNTYSQRTNNETDVKPSSATDTSTSTAVSTDSHTESSVSTSTVTGISTATATDIPSPPVNPMPEPVPHLDPVPEPQPKPQPEPITEPKPAPQPKPVPQPKPAPQPEPIPQPKPVPQPKPLPQPAPLPHEPSSYRMPEFEERWGLKREIYEKAVRVYASKRTQLQNPRFVTVVDFSKRSNQKRFFLFDLAKDRMNNFLTSHGSGSDPAHSGIATAFSNDDESKKSSVGVYLTMGTYSGKHGYSLRLRGLDPSNSQAFDRLIVVHGANYVNEEKKIAGRSHGCFALDPKLVRDVIDRIKGGSLIVAER